MTPEHYDFTPAENRDFIGSAALLCIGIWLLAIYGQDWALFLNNLIANF